MKNRKVVTGAGAQEVFILSESKHIKLTVSVESLIVSQLLT